MFECLKPVKRGFHWMIHFLSFGLISKQSTGSPPVTQSLLLGWLVCVSFLFHLLLGVLNVVCARLLQNDVGRPVQCTSHYSCQVAAVFHWRFARQIVRANSRIHDIILLELKEWGPECCSLWVFHGFRVLALDLKNHFRLVGGHFKGRCAFKRPASKMATSKNKLWTLGD